MYRNRKRHYHVEATLEGDEFDVIRTVEGSPHSAVLETYASETLAAQVALTLQSFANRDFEIRENPTRKLM